MAKYVVLKRFYGSSAWINFRAAYIGKRIVEDRGSMCDYCGEYIDRSDDVTLHHIEELTPDNYQDTTISLNEDNIKQVHGACHNKIHKHAGERSRRVFIIYGPPLSGKSHIVKRRSWPGDIIVDMDNLFEAVSGLPRYEKPYTILQNVLAMQSLLIDNIKTRYGRWDNAWIIGGYAERYKREKLAADLGATIIYMDATKNECIERLYNDPERSKRGEEWEGYINKWFEQHTT